MKRFVLIGSVLLLVVANTLWAAELDVSEQKQDRWSRLSEIEREKISLFDQYQADKELLELKYQDGLNQIKMMDGNQKDSRKKLNRELNKQKEKLLRTYRSDQRRLSKEEKSLKGTRFGRYGQVDIRKKLERDPSYSTKINTKPVRRGNRNYIKNKNSNTVKPKRKKTFPSYGITNDKVLPKGSFSN